VYVPRVHQDPHGSYNTLLAAYELFPEGDLQKVTPFARAMDDVFKFDNTLNVFDAYKKYLASKTWVADNYIKLPVRKPDWLV
jgi:hypothetical protein